MGVVSSFSGSNILVKVALCLVIAANFFSWIAFTTSSWIVLERPSIADVHQGIWRQCEDTYTSTCSFLDGTASDWYGAFQAFSVLAFATLTVSMILIVLFVFGPKCQQNSEAGMAASILAIVGAVCWLLAVIIFVAEYDNNRYDLGFSFGLAIVALIVAAIGGILAIVALKGGSGSSSTQPSA